MSFQNTFFEINFTVTIVWNTRKLATYMILLSGYEIHDQEYLTNPYIPIYQKILPLFISFELSRIPHLSLEILSPRIWLEYFLEYCCCLVILLHIKLLQQQMVFALLSKKLWCVLILYLHGSKGSKYKYLKSCMLWRWSIQIRIWILNLSEIEPCSLFEFFSWKFT